MNIRYEKLRAEMRRLGLDAVWITSEANHQYFSDFHNPDGWMLVTAEKSYVFADFRYVEAAKNEVFPECTVILPEGGRGKYLLPLFEEHRIRTVGYEDADLTCRAYNALTKDLSECEFVPLGAALEEIRSVKTEDEIEKMIRAQRIAEAALDHVLKMMNYNMTEIEVAAELDYFMKRNGADKPGFETIAVSGTASSVPHGVPRNVKLESGFLTMDFGACVDGYRSDMTRTVVIGKADADMRRLYNTVLQAQLAALDAIAEGKKNADMDKVARDIIDNAGYKGAFGHSLGHGVGLKIHELPNLSWAVGERTLRAGEIVTVEPGIYLEGKYGCRIEDMVVVTAGGNRNMTSAPKEMIEI